MDTERPLILEVEDFKQELVNFFNELTKKYKIPAYFVEPIVANIYNQVAAAAHQELSQLRSKTDEN